MKTLIVPVDDEVDRVDLGCAVDEDADPADR